MKRIRILASMLSWLLVGFWLMHALACSNDKAHQENSKDLGQNTVLNNSSTTNALQNCASFHGAPEKCAQFKDGKICEYDNNTNKCIVKIQKPLEMLQGCRAHLSKEDCPKDACTFSDGQCIEKVGPQSIFIWQTLPLPAGVGINDIDKFSVSKDLAHLYAYVPKGPKAGLYHSANNGERWSALGNLKGGKPFNDKMIVGLNPASVQIDTAASQGLDALIATEHGAMIRQGKKLALLKGANGFWGIDAALHYEGNFNNQKAVIGIRDAPIAMAAIVNTPTGEALVFRQKGLKNLWFHHCDKDQDERPKMKKVKMAQNPLDLQWSVVANGREDDLILYAKGHPLVSIAGADSDWSKDWTDASNNGNANMIEGFRPATPPDGIKWSEGNEMVSSLAVLDNNGTEHILIGLSIDPTKPAQSGGVAHHDAPIQENNGIHPDLDLVGKSVIGIDTRYDDKARLITAGHGVFGINADGSLNPDADINFETIARSKAEMMTGNDKNPVDLEGLDDKLRGIFGQRSDRAYFWVASKGLFLRSQIHGEPRS